jgi:hypothetical protein
VKGRGAVSGKPPEATHCNNIGAVHREQIYPTLKQWFALPVPVKEYQKRFTTEELQCWNDKARKELAPSKLVHQLAAEADTTEPPPGDPLPGYLPLLGISALKPGQGKVEDLGPEQAIGKGESAIRVRKQLFRRASDPVLAVPVVTLVPARASKNTPVVIALAQEGKAGFLAHRAETISQLLRSGVAVCLPDLRGCGETRPTGEGRGRQSGGTSVSAVELMHGRTVPGTQLQELMLLMQELPRQGFGAIALWGDSFAEPNESKQNFAVPLDADRMPRQSEPMGGLLALLGGVFGGEQVKGVYVRGGLVSFRSLLESPFCYVPHDAVIPGALTAGDLPQLADALKTRKLRLEAMVDGVNRRVLRDVLAKAYPRAEVLEQPAAPNEVAAWLSQQVRK